MIQDLRNRTEKMQEMFTKDLEELKNKQTEMNNTLEGIDSRIMEAEERINDLKDRMVEITTAEQNTEKKNEKKKKNEDSLRDLWDNIKHISIRIFFFFQHSYYMGPRRRRERGPKKTFEEIIAENFPNMGKEIVKSKKPRESQAG